MNLSFVLLAVMLWGLASACVIWPLTRSPLQKASVDVAAGQPARPWHAVWIATGLSFFVGGLYAIVGEPAALNVQTTAVVTASQQPDKQVGQPQIEAMVQRLATRLKSQPDDEQGWRMLVKSYETLGRFDDAVGAYQRVLELAKPDPELLVNYAVTLGMARGQTLSGEPEALINQALAIDPHHIQALALSGSAAYERQDYQRAVAQWQTLLSLIPADAEMRPTIERQVDKAKSLIH